MNEKNEGRLVFTIMIIGFIILNYMIIAYGHTLTYNKGTNNCTHMSSQLEGMFETIGIPVTIKTGSRESGNRHMWISICNIIDVDSVILLPFQNSQYNIKQVDYVSFDEYEKK